MFNFNSITEEYLTKLIEFLYSISWMFEHLNTQYVKHNVLTENFNYLSLLNQINLNEFVNLRQPQNNHPNELQELTENINYFRINYEIINTENWKCKKQQKRMSVKKTYEIENMSEIINEICKDEVQTLVDLGSGLGYLDEHLHVKYGFKIIGLEGSLSNQLQAVKRQEKYYPNSIGKVKHVQHFITAESGNFIQSQVDEIEENSKIGLFGLHPCGDLSITSIKLFLEIDRIKKLIISPCCYHKMSPKDENFSEFHYFPLSETVKKLKSRFKRDPFLRPFLRLAGQQSPIKFKEMTDNEHFIHGKNMFERAVVETIILSNETSKRVNNVTFTEGRLKYEDITYKYQLYDKTNNNLLPWTNNHLEHFNKIRNELPNGEELSENLFCLQTAVQNSCENLVIMDRVFYIYEQMKKFKIDLKISMKKLQNEKLSPRCLILIVEKS